MRYKVFAASLLAFGGFFASTSASACSCEGLPKTLQEALATYPYIFSGRVKDRKLGAGGLVVVENTDGTKTATQFPEQFDVSFEVSRVFKGEIPTSVLVRTSSECQDPFREGEYLIFANEAKQFFIQYVACALSYSQVKNTKQFEKYSGWLKRHTK